MLNALKLSELLARNADPKLYPRIFVMSPNGTLMAYSTPVDIKELRDQAALVSMAWKEHLSPSSTTSNHDQPLSPTSVPAKELTGTRNLETLTIETGASNIIIRAIQPSLLLILVGSVPPSRQRQPNPIFRITTEARGDARYPAEGDSMLPSPVPGADDVVTKKRTPSILSTMSTREKDLKLGVLHIQRKKIDALTTYLRKDFNAKGFVMPDDSSFP